MYYARRRTVSDAQFPEGGERHIYAYMPLVSENQRFAANFMHYFAHNGLQGIHKVYRASGDNPVHGMELIRSVLSAGPLKARQLLSDALASQRLTAQNDMDSADKLLTHFFPQRDAPIYLLLHQDMTLSQGWFRLGTWGESVQQRQKPHYYPYFLTKQEKDKFLTTAGVLYIDGPGAGVFSFNKELGQKNIKVSKLFIQTGEEVITAKLNTRSDLSFEMYRPSRFGALMDSRMSATTFNTLFIRHLPDTRYFELIGENIPHYQIWQVHGDRITW
jgi:dolichyl-diphosphooligosaccharide--protein glycosyltransferase